MTLPGSKTVDRRGQGATEAPEAPAEKADTESADTVESSRGLKEKPGEQCTIEEIQRSPEATETPEAPTGKPGSESHGGVRSRYCPREGRGERIDSRFKIIRQNREATAVPAATP